MSEPAPDPSRHELACVGCGYILTGLASHAACPECSLPVWRSKMGTDLKYTPREFRATLSRGAILVILATVVHLITFMGMMAGIIYFNEALHKQPPGFGAPWFIPLLFLVPNVLGFFGYWIYTTPVAGSEASEPRRSWRRILRFSVLAQAVGLVLQIAFAAAGFPTSINGGRPLAAQATGFLQVGLLAVLFVIWFLQFIAAVCYTAELARRLPDADLARKTRRMLIWLPVWTVLGMGLVVGPLVAVVLYCTMLLRLRGRVQALPEP